MGNDDLRALSRLKLPFPIFPINEGYFIKIIMTARKLCQPMWVFLQAAFKANLPIMVTRQCPTWFYAGKVLGNLRQHISAVL